MAKLINILLALVAYLCIATVVTIALGLGYLWHTERLNGEKVFRMLALLHDVDLQQISAAAHEENSEKAPPEEPSLGDTMRYQQVLDRNHEVKLLALQRGSQEYHHRFQLLKEQADRNHRLAIDLQNRLKQQAELTTQENIATVVSQLEQLKPEIGKESLMRWIEEGRMDDAILLMSKMSDTKLSKILKTFETDEELNRLHAIHERILGDSGAAQLEKALNELKSLENN